MRAGTACYATRGYSHRYNANGTCFGGSNGGFYEHEGLGCGLDLYYNQSNVETNCIDALTSHYNRGTKKWDTTGDFGIYRQFFIINNLGISIDMDDNTGNGSSGNDFMPVVQLVNITPDPVTQFDDPFCKTNITDADANTVNAYTWYRNS